MKVKNKILVLCFMSSFLTSCLIKTPNTIASVESNKSLSNISQNYSIANSKNLEIKDNNLNFNLSEKNSSSFSLKLKFNKSSNFSIKSNTNGIEGKVKSNINLLRIYLVNSNISNLNGTNIKYGPFDIDTTNNGTLATFFSNVKSSGGVGNLSFNNVGTGTYYVAIAAYSSNTTINNTTNITNSTNNITSGTNFGNFALSNSGGDSPGLNGIVTVSSMVVIGRTRYALSNNGTIDLGVTLNLINSYGATIDATTTITEGNHTIPATTLQ